MKLYWRRIRRGRIIPPCWGMAKHDPLNDLWQVGWSKPIGYLPLRAIESCGSSATQLSAWAEKNDLKHALVTEGEGHVVSGAVYIWHEGAVQRLLNLNPKILTRSGWPTEADAFVKTVATRTAEGEDIYDLVGAMFDDKRMAQTPRVHRPR